MIYFPDSLVAVELAAGRPLTHPRICYQSFGDGLGIAAVTASSETAGGPRDAPLIPNTHQYWEPSALPATWEIDFGASRTIDYVGIAAHTIGSSLVSVLVETNNDDTEGSPPELAWTEFGNPATGAVEPADDAVLLFLDARRSVRRVRITLTDLATASVAPRLAVIRSGLSLAMAEPIRGGGHAPVTMQHVTELTRQLSRGGQFLSQGIRRLGFVVSASFDHLESAWVRDTFMPFVLAARTLPFIYAWRPEDYSEEVAYVWATADIRPQYSGTLDWFSVAWDMVGYDHG